MYYYCWFTQNCLGDFHSWRLCVFIFIIIIYRCAVGFYEATPLAAACSACPDKCPTCSSGTVCTACATDSNRIAVTTGAEDCAYLFL